MKPLSRCESIYLCSKKAEIKLIVKMYNGTLYTNYYCCDCFKNYKHRLKNKDILWFDKYYV